MRRREFLGRLGAVGVWPVLFHHRAGHSGGPQPSPSPSPTLVRVAQVYLTAPETPPSNLALFQSGVFQPVAFQGV